MTTFLYFLPASRALLRALLLTLLTLTGTFAQTFVQKTGTDNSFENLIFQGDGANVFPSLADFDNDGDLDLVSGSFTGDLRYFKNTGTPTAPVYTEQTGSDNPFNGFDDNNYVQPAAGDLNADGKTDVVVGRQDGTFLLLLNTGTATVPAFTVADPNPFAGIDAGVIGAPALADMDGDGLLDFFCSDIYNVNQYYKNTGTASNPAFTLKTGTDNPFNNLSIRQAALGDINGDGTVDLLAVGINGLLVVPNLGTTTAPSITPNGAFFIIQNFGFGLAGTLGDVNGDGRLDIVLGYYTGGFYLFLQVPPPPSITQNPTPDSLTVCTGGNASSTITATGNAPLNYQWYKGAASTTTGTLVPGQNTATLSLSNLQLADGGLYYCRVSNAAGETWSSAFTLTVIPATVIQSITPSQGLCGTQPFTLSVQALGQNLTYQWYRIATPFNQPIAGATAASLTLPFPQAVGSYYAVVSGSCGPPLTSQTITLTPLPPTTLQVTSLVNVVCEGSNLTLSVRGSGPGSLSYAWRKDAPSGAVIGTGSSFTLTNAQVADAGTYYASVQGSCNPVTVSIPVTVRYFRITAQPVSVNLCSGVSTLSVGVQAVGLTPTYQWKRNGVNIAGATQASYPVSYRSGGTYTVEVRTSCGNLTSQGAVVGCGNSRLALETVAEPSLIVAPNPVSGREIRCRIVGLDQPEFRLTTATGQSQKVLSSRGEDEREYVIRPAGKLPVGVYILQAGEGSRRLSQRVLVSE